MVKSLMYADETVIFTHGKNAEEVANKLTDVLAKVISWLNQCYLKLNVPKTSCMFFSIEHRVDIKQNIFISEDYWLFRNINTKGFIWTHVLVLKHIKKGM